MNLHCNLRNLDKKQPSGNMKKKIKCKSYYNLKAIGVGLVLVLIILLPTRNLLFNECYESKFPSLDLFFVVICFVKILNNIL